MVADHRADVASFRKMSLSAKDADVKAWAAKTLPTLEEHLTLAQEASRGAAVGTSGTSSASPTDKGTGVKPEPTTPPAGGTTDTPGGTMVRPGGSEPTGQPAPGGGASGIGSPR
jgi:putative membrane protein